MSAGPEGLRSLTNPKAIIVDRWPSLMQTTIPKVLDYPLRSLKHSWFVYRQLPLCMYIQQYLFLSFQGLFEWSHSLPVWRWLAYRHQWPSNRHCSR